jgi:hypothetical protein
MEKWNNGKIQLTLLNPHHSSIPTFHYPHVSIYINFASSRQQKRGDPGSGRLKINIEGFNS